MVPVANIETSTLAARRKLESIKFGPDEIIISFDVQSLFANFPVKETIELASALKSLYSSDHAPELSRLTLKKLFEASCDECIF